MPSSWLFLPSTALVVPAKAVVQLAAAHAP
jgi:hypothetical protein